MATNNKKLGELLPINENNGQRAVNARDLYLFLGYDKSQWARWYTKNIINNDYAEEGVDYQTFDIVSNGNATKEFALSIDFAKELSMLARNERGKQARRYFISCEKAAREFAKATIEQKKPKREPTLTTKVRVGLEWVKGVSEILNLSDSSKLSLLGKVAKPLELPLPDYTPSKGITKSATALLKENRIALSARKFNEKLLGMGFLQKLERKSSKGIKTFLNLTKEGLAYGENVVSPQNPNETQPHFYQDTFSSLLSLLGLQPSINVANEN